MAAVINDDFRWDRLLRGIQDKRVIPVIGSGLYRVEIETEDKAESPLYEYLAEQVLRACGITSIPGKNQNFAKACFQFLKNHDYNDSKLTDLLKKILPSVRLIHPNPLWKLARIKNFEVFITTAYDNFLASTLKTVRDIPTKQLYYTLDEKELARVDLDMFQSLRKSACSLVYQIFGNLYKNIVPAFTEKDILESILEFHKDLFLERKENKLYWRLKNSSFLFIGCGFDDWLYRFFIQIVADEPQYSSRHKNYYKFVVDSFDDNKALPKGFKGFLSDYGVDVFSSSDGSEFVDTLFEKAGESIKNGIEVISPSDFPGTVFISFEGNDRVAARKLAGHLREDGIDVWLDESKFKGGDNVDKTIIRAIDNCPAFIPLVSQNSRQIQDSCGKLKYHIQENDWAYKNTITGAGYRKTQIFPVIIDNTDIKFWTYHKFKKYYSFKIPGGEKRGNYEALKDSLMRIQIKIRD